MQYSWLPARMRDCKCCRAFPGSDPLGGFLEALYLTLLNVYDKHNPLAIFKLLFRLLWSYFESSGSLHSGTTNAHVTIKALGCHNQEPWLNAWGAYAPDSQQAQVHKTNALKVTSRRFFLLSRLKLPANQ